MTDVPFRQAELHVSPAGSDTTGTGAPDAPFATVSKAAETCPGSLILIHGGTYGRIRLGQRCSGTEESPTVIRAADGEKAVIRCEGGTCIHLVNVGNIVLDGLETEGGTHGIRYESTREAEDTPLAHIVLKNCTVHGVRGVHGICVYARRDTLPVRDLVIEGCHVYDCMCGSSESVVINGNIDGFLIAGNRIHDNNNIGIDMIGFEGTARHPDSVSGMNPYENDFVRNGVCRDNIVYRICTEGNMAYYRDGGFDRCAGGIYVDGGQRIEIARNFVFDCDIGIEVATEHSPDDNELFRVTDVRVHDNVIAGCHGFAGLCFGGYARDLGFTESCSFDHNTLADNGVGIAVQRSRDNRIFSNLLLGGETAVLYNESCRKEDLVNAIEGNAAAGLMNGRGWRAEYGTLYPEKSDAADAYRSLLPDIGSSFCPDPETVELVQTKA